MRAPVEDRGLLPAADIPVAVLLGARHRQPPPRPEGIEFGFEFRDYFDATIRQRVRAMSQWGPPGAPGAIPVSTSAAHDFHREESGLAIDAIRRLVDLTASERCCGSM